MEQDYVETEATTKRCSRCPVVLMILGALCIILAGVGYPILNHVLHTEIEGKVVLKNGSETYDMWQKPTLPIYIQFYVFDLTNPVDVVNGKRPVVKEKGPYTYKEQREKTDIEFDHENGTVTYREKMSYHFVRNMSIGSDDELFTTANLPVITLANAINYWNSTSKWLKNLFERALATDPFVTKTVRQMVFGYQDILLTLGTIIAPDIFYTDMVGIMTDRNNSDNGLFTVYTGENDDLAKLGQIKEYDNASTLNYWTSDIANMINGSDGSLFSPFVKKDQPIYLFSTDICRSIYATYKTSLQYNSGLDVWRFEANEEVIANSSENPANAGFCTPAGACMGTGVLNLTTCKLLDTFEVPIASSYPHFYLADQKYVDAVGGMTPDGSQHTTYLELEPNTGVMVKIAKKIQINVHIKNFPGSYNGIEDLVYPILWLNESATLDDEHVNQLHKEVGIPINVTHDMQYAAFAVGSCFFLIGLIWIIASRKQEEKSLLYPVNQSKDSSSDRAPLIT